MPPNNHPLIPHNKRLSKGKLAMCKKTSSANSGGFKRRRDGIACFEEASACLSYHGYGKNKAALIMNTRDFDRLFNYISGSERQHQEEESRRKYHLRDFEKSKALAKDWPDSKENIVKAKKEENSEWRRRYQEAGEKVLEQTAWENRATERKTLAEAKATRFGTRREVKELHGSYILSEVLDERKAQIAFDRKSKRLAEEKKKRDEEKIKSDVVSYYEELKQKAEMKSKEKSTRWKGIAEQLEHRERSRKLEEESRLCDLAAMNVAERSGEGKGIKITGTNVIKRQIDPEVLECQRILDKDSEEIKAERIREDELQEKEIKEYHESVMKFRQAMEERKKTSPVEAARNAVLKDFTKMHEQKVLRERQRIKEEDAIEMEGKGFFRNEDMVALKKKQMERKVDTLLEYNELQEKNMQKKLDSIKQRNYERLQQLKLAEEEEKRQLNKLQKTKNKQEEVSHYLKEQMKENENKNRQEEEYTTKFLEREKIEQDKQDQEFIEYATNLVKNMESQSKDTRPMVKVIQKFKQTAS